MALSWKARGKLFHVMAFLLPLIAAGVIIFFLLTPNPSCTDGRQNGDETGIDCGGSCQSICQADKLNPVVLWARSFGIADGSYHSVALIENPNRNAELVGTPYSFKLYDSEGFLIVERTGELYLPRGSTVPIFESHIQTGEREPSRTIFEMDDFSIEWISPQGNQPLLRTTDEHFTNTSNPRLEARLVNEGAEGVRNVRITALLFNEEGNAVHASETFVDMLQGRGEQRIVFTWPEQFEEKIVLIRMYPVAAR